jgi:two-component system OmpR family response regulator
MQAMRILVVEDDPVIAGAICHGLTDCGHSTQRAANGGDAIAACRHGGIDALVLDRMLPDMSGLDVMACLSAEGSLPPVLMLSALASVQDRVEGLKAGADDYLAKPFDTGELDARLAALVRRGHRTRPAPEESGDLVVGRLRLDSAGHRAFLGEDSIELNRKQFSLLAFLMRHTDRLVTRAMLLEHVWGYAFDPATNIVESNLSRLRGRLQAVGCDAVETRRGEGYCLRSARCG